MIDKVLDWGVPTVLLKISGGVVSRGDASYSPLHYGNCEEIHINQPPFRDTVSLSGDYTIPRPYVAVYNHARLVGQEDPAGLSREGSLIKEVGRGLEFAALRQIRDAGEAYGWYPMFLESVFPKSSQFEPDTYLDEAVHFIRRTPEINYYHWITEMLPRIRGIEIYREKFGRTPPVLIEEDPPSWIEESLDLMNVTADTRIQWTYDKAEVGRLITPRYTRKAPPGDYQPSRRELEWVRNRLRRSTPPRSSATPERLFVSREDVSTRRLSNRPDVLNILFERDFHVIVPSEYTVEEQVQLFRNSDLIVGPHGAGLTNMLFSEDATTIELFPKDQQPEYFYLISELFDLNYDYLIGDDANPDFCINVGDLADSLDYHLSNG